MARVFLLALMLLVLGQPLAAADKFTFMADRTDAVMAQGRERTILSGNARVVTGDTEIEAARIELYGSDFRFLVCSGGILVKDSRQGFLLRCENLFFDRELEMARVQGYSEMLDQKNNLVVKSSYLENWGQENLAIIQIGVRILKEDESGVMICRAEYARYDRDAEILELSGMPHVSWKGDDYNAVRIRINLDTDEIILEGRVSGTISTGEKE